MSFATGIFRLKPAPIAGKAFAPRQHPPLLMPGGLIPAYIQGRHLNLHA